MKYNFNLDDLMIPVAKRHNEAFTEFIEELEKRIGFNATWQQERKTSGTHYNQRIVYYELNFSHFIKRAVMTCEFNRTQRRIEVTPNTNGRIRIDFFADWGELTDKRLTDKTVLEIFDLVPKMKEFFIVI